MCRIIDRPLKGTRDQLDQVAAPGSKRRNCLFLLKRFQQVRNTTAHISKPALNGCERVSAPLPLLQRCPKCDSERGAADVDKNVG